MRPVALGRKNWMHIGSPQAGPKVAAILSVVESCRRLKLPVRDYLVAVLPGFADLPIQRLPDLTPTAWVAQHSWTQATGVLAGRRFCANNRIVSDLADHSPVTLSVTPRSYFVDGG